MQHTIHGTLEMDQDGITSRLYEPLDRVATVVNGLHRRVKERCEYCRFLEKDSCKEVWTMEGEALRLVHSLHCNHLSRVQIEVGTSTEAKDRKLPELEPADRLLSRKTKQRTRIA